MLSAFQETSFIKKRRIACTNKPCWNKVSTNSFTETVRNMSDQCCPRNFTSSRGWVWRVKKPFSTAEIFVPARPFNPKIPAFFHSATVSVAGGDTEVYSCKAKCWASGLIERIHTSKGRSCGKSFPKGMSKVLPTPTWICRLNRKRTEHPHFAAACWKTNANFVLSRFLWCTCSDVSFAVLVYIYIIYVYIQRVILTVAIASRGE